MLQHRSMEKNAKWKKPDTKRLLLYEYIYMEFPEEENLYRYYVYMKQSSGCLGLKITKWQRWSFWGDGHVLKLYCVDGYTTLYNFTENHWICTLKMGKFYGMYIISQYSCLKNTVSAQQALDMLNMQRKLMT